VLRWANGLLRSTALLFERHADPATLRFDEPALPIVFILLLAIATVRILIWPSRSSLPPLLLPTAQLSNAITWSSSTFEIATMVGPAIGGFLIAFGGFHSVYWLSVVLEITFFVLLGRVRYFTPPQPARSPAHLARYAGRSRIHLAAPGDPWRQHA